MPNSHVIGAVIVYTLVGTGTGIETESSLNVFVNATLGSRNRILVPEMNGVHLGPLNHEIFAVYSQMLLDESFEMALATPGPSYLPRVNGSISWTNRTTGMKPTADTHGLRFGPDALNGNVSARLIVPKAGIVVSLVNRGLYQQGFAFKANVQYEGYLFARAAKPTKLQVALESDESILAERALSVPGGNQWTKLDFQLIPNASTTCEHFPENKEPVFCTSSAEENNTCVVCGGQFSVSASDEGADVDIDFCFLEAGEWGRWQSLHIHRALGEWLSEWNVRMIRYRDIFRLLETFLEVLSRRTVGAHSRQRWPGWYQVSQIFSRLWHFRGPRLGRLTRHDSRAILLARGDARVAG